MKRTAAWLATGALLVSGLAITSAAPAAAVSDVEVSATDVKVRGDKCGKTHIEAWGDWGGEEYGNSVEIDVYDARGNWAGGDYVSDDRDGYVSKRIRLCGAYDRPGRYTVKVAVDSWDEDGDTSAKGRTKFTFTVKKVHKKKAKIQTKKRKIKRGPYRWAVPATLRRAGHPYRGAEAWVQVKLYGSWWDVDYGYTNKRGRFGWMFKPSRYTWRYVFKGDSKTKRATSRPFRTKGSGRGAGLEAPRQAPESFSPELFGEYVAPVAP